MTHRERSELGGMIAQAGAAGCVGAWAASIAEPPEGARWVFLGVAVALAAVAGILHRRSRSAGEP